LRSTTASRIKHLDKRPTTAAATKRTAAEQKKENQINKKKNANKQRLAPPLRAAQEKKEKCKHEAGGSYHACDCAGFWATASRALGKKKM
jgi:hypothetical protein